MSDREQFVLRVRGVAFRCDCGCNVFHKKPCDKHDPEYACNACGARFEGVYA